MVLGARRWEALIVEAESKLCCHLDKSCLALPACGICSASVISTELTGRSLLIARFCWSGVTVLILFMLRLEWLLFMLVLLLKLLRLASLTAGLTWLCCGVAIGMVEIIWVWLDSCSFAFTLSMDFHLASIDLAKPCRHAANSSSVFWFMLCWLLVVSRYCRMRDLARPCSGMNSAGWDSQETIGCCGCCCDEVEWLCDDGGEFRFRCCCCCWALLWLWLLLELVAEGDDEDGGDEANEGDDADDELDAVLFGLSCRKFKCLWEFIQVIVIYSRCFWTSIQSY